MNDNSRVSNSIKNVSFGMIAQLVQMVLGFVSRTIFIKYLSVEYLGVNGLFTNILTLLSLTELGITSAILFSLYKPLANKDEKKIAGLIHFFSKIYFAIAIAITIIGLLLMPFLNQIVQNPSAKIAQDLNIIYLLFLFNTVSSYFFYYKLSLFQADQRSHIVSKSNTVVFILQNVTQIVLLIVYQNFILYLAVQSIFQLSGNLVVSYLVNKYYPFLKKYRDEKIDSETKKHIYINVKSTAFIKIGGLLVNSTQNLILNYFSGLIMVGLLSNYNLLIGLASGLIMQVFAGLTGSIGHINATESIEKKASTFTTINFANFWIYGLAVVGIIILVNDFITLWIGVKFILPIAVVIGLACNFYVYGMQNAVWSFKTTNGLFKQGQYLIIGTAIINLVLSFALGKQYGLVGIIAATAIARLVTNCWYDPYIVFKLALHKNPMDYFKKYLLYVLVLVIAVASIYAISSVLPFTIYINFSIKLFLCLLIPNVLFYLFFNKTDEYKYLITVGKMMIGNIKTKLGK